MSRCSYDDRSQAAVDRDWARDARIRGAILDELDLRLEAALANLEEAEELIGRQEFNFANYRPAAGDVELTRLLTLPDISPLTYEAIEVDGNYINNLLEAATYDPLRDSDASATPVFLRHSIGAMRKQLIDHQRTVARQRGRDDDARRLVQKGSLDRKATLIDLQVDELQGDKQRFMVKSSVREWIEHGGEGELSRAAFNLADAYPEEFAAAIMPAAATWDGGWQIPEWNKLLKPTVRYRSPITRDQRFELIGTLFMAIACFVLVVIGPVVTATATAREREAGTLPVLRMTGMSANDLALAMIVGPNVFALVLGGSLLLSGAVLLALSGHVVGLVLPVVLLLALAAATHLTAIGLGDALLLQSM
ncbi:MAG: hypothetical protein KC431_26750, partial [Myxococcales bacterium]|nr:hypothetical protein [Myxococcales bacterium]